MANSAEPSASLSFTSSSYLSNGSSAPPAPTEQSTNLEIVSLSKLSSNLERLLVDSDFDCTDADIVVEGVDIGIHRCILAARSKFFRDTFAGGGNSEGKRPKYCMNELLPDGGRVGKEAFMIFLGYLYTGRLKQSPPEVSTCVDPSCAHDACRPAVSFVVELMYASWMFQIPELVSLFQRRLSNFVDKALVEDVIPILLVAFHSQLNQLLSRCIQRVARSNFDNISLEKELPHEAVQEIKAIRKKSQADDSIVPDMDPVLEKGIKRIHRALDSDDVELVKLLLTESHVTLDDATALHYAAAYCDSKVVAEILELGLANVNLRNNRGYTPLHVAAMRREPAVIVSLLDKGASASELTSDSQSAVSICRRLTRAKDYNTKTMQGQESNKDRICIDLLEREIRRNPLSGNEFTASPFLADDVHANLIYLENRVAFARIFFPAEAKLAMKIAQAEATSEFAGLAASRSSGNLREVDLNETPSVQNKRLRSRVDALMKTVGLGHRYFPHCSKVLDKFLEDDHPDLFFLQKGTPDEQRIKRMRFCELKDDVLKAFRKDKAVSGRSGLASSSSSSSSQKGEGKQHKSTRK
ncbi:BTB/POZ domain and ankyrin repeat-containing protein NPR2 isoform X2 [Asparagus officinalis]|uniref:BTB/POZ domain and ankyrin repeat-containing protein NPR2 isoform X1 n=1 Tax=Asparagus officinalis TaxID=4686 RepID=UPI00098E388C|nr:BTB/POZ domain and ankyrin repeat-containing protein NPR2 isoform X1 [Asparagus officinalis]XP_020271413.1 BTB/POZ domain and ankyrin repeat-containing protein NPR2 isoform X2 [Asparagus officinalis]